MEENALRYDQWVEQALRDVIRRALTYAAREGLPGDHHFYITFITGGDGVHITDFLRTEYPQEMTIVLQHQFWDLIVDDDGFEVTLSFNNRNQRLRIPFAAVTAFADPAINFALQLKPMNGVSEEAAAAEPAVAAVPPPEPEVEPPPDEDKKGEVITLDAFRKK